MREVERQETNSLQAEVPRLRAGKLQISQSLKGLNEKLPNWKLAATTFAVILSPTQYARDLENLSQGLQWMHVEENKPVSAAGNTGLGTDDTNVTEVVEPTCSVATGYRLPVHLNRFLQYLLKYCHNFSFVNNVSSSVERSRMAR